MSMDIAVGVGLGDLIFGMAMADVIRVVGEPDKALDIEETGTVEYFFNSAMLTVRFSDAVFCESIYCTLEFQFDRLIGIEFSPLLDPDDEYIWPYSGTHHE